MLAAWEVQGLESTLLQFDVSARTLQRYRTKADGDAKLSQLVAVKKSELLHTLKGSHDWTEQSAIVMTEGLRVITRWLAHLEAPTAKDVYTITGVLKTLGELNLAQRILNTDESYPEGSLSATLPQPSSRLAFAAQSH